MNYGLLIYTKMTMTILFEVFAFHKRLITKITKPNST